MYTGKVIALSLFRKYYKLYCLDLGKGLLFTRVATTFPINKFFFVNNSCYNYNWRWLPTLCVVLLSHIRLKQAPYNCLPRQSRLKVWIFKCWPKPTAKLLDPLVGFYVKICVDGETFPKKCVEVWSIFRLSTQMLIGLLVNGIRQPLFLLQVIRSFPESLDRWMKERWTFPALCWWWEQLLPKLVQSWNVKY